MAQHLLKQEEVVALEQQMVNAMKSYDFKFASSFPDDLAILAFVMQSLAATPLILSRAKYAEDTLEKLVNQGTNQYLILGAGMDTFAFRRPDISDQINIFEVDHPVTQDFKLSRLKESGLEHKQQFKFASI